MADPMRIRAQAQGAGAVVRVLMMHEMETGQRKDAAGKTIPAWHIQEVSAALNGKPVMSAQWGPAVSKNPFLQFMVKGAKAGDKIAITWKDNRGDTRTDEAVVAEASRLARVGEASMTRALATCAALAFAAAANAQNSTADGIAQYRAMLADGNPAELFEAKGEQLWKTARGPKNATLERCDLGKGPGVVKGAFVELPRWFADTRRCRTWSRGCSPAWARCRAWTPTGLPPRRSAAKSS